MSDLAHVAFAASAAVAVLLQSRYFEALALRGAGGVRHDHSWATEVRDHPTGLPWIVASETFRRLKALATHQAEPPLERLRLIAVASIALAMCCFLWTAVLAVT